MDVWADFSQYTFVMSYFVDTLQAESSKGKCLKPCSNPYLNVCQIFPKHLSRSLHKPFSKYMSKPIPKWLCKPMYTIFHTNVQNQYPNPCLNLTSTHAWTFVQNQLEHCFTCARNRVKTCAQNHTWTPLCFMLKAFHEPCQNQAEPIMQPSSKPLPKTILEPCPNIDQTNGHNLTWALSKILSKPMPQHIEQIPAQINAQTLAWTHTQTHA